MRGNMRRVILFDLDALGRQMWFRQVVELFLPTRICNAATDRLGRDRLGGGVPAGSV